MNKIGRLLKVEEPNELFRGQICSKRHLLHRERSPTVAVPFIDACTQQWRLSLFLLGEKKALEVVGDLKI